LPPLFHRPVAITASLWSLLYLLPITVPPHSAVLAATIFPDP
jgi:hypothetical protein